MARPRRMSRPPQAPLFVEREAYRRRRLLDAARILPVAGLVAMLLPALWSAGGQTDTSAEALYLFALWALLVAAAALLSPSLRDEIDRTRGHPPAPRPPAAPPGAGDTEA